MKVATRHRRGRASAMLVHEEQCVMIITPVGYERVLASYTGVAGE